MALTPPILPLHIVDVGASAFELGTIMAIYYIVGFVARMPLAIVSDRMGRWPMILYGTLAQVLSNGLYFWIQSPLWFYPAQALAASGWASFDSSMVAAVLDITPNQNRAKALGKFYTIFAVGSFLGPLLCSLLTIKLGYRQVFLITALYSSFGLIASLIGRLYFPFLRVMSEKGRDQYKIRVSLRRIVSSKVVLALSIGHIATGFPDAVLTTIFPVYANQALSFTSSSISLLFTIRAFSNVASRFSIERLCEKIKFKRTLILSYIFSMLGIFFIPLVGGFFILALVMAISGIGWGMKWVPNTLILDDNISLRDRALAVAFTNAAMHMGLSLGSLMVGSTTAILPVPIMFELSALIILFGVLAVTVLIKERNVG
jgi:DHA1 family multidrug resistance protein-like MFS transporter